MELAQQISLLQTINPAQHHFKSLTNTSKKYHRGPRINLQETLSFFIPHRH
jgi:hypothetical protein